MNKGEREQLKEVMALHDEVMPKMDDLHNLSEALMQKLAADTTMTEDERLTVENTIERLMMTDEAMMTWMREFEPDKQTVSVSKYLEQEFVKMRALKMETEQIILEAQEVLE